MSEEQSSERILVIGGSHGIGLEVVKLLLARGAEVITMSRTTGELEQLEGTAGGFLEHRPRDVIQSGLQSHELPDRLDGFVYCPGSINLGPLQAAKAELLREDFELNVVGAMTCFQAAVPALKSTGKASAVFFSTIAVDHGIVMHTYVAAAKGALQALSKTWAAELAPAIRVNCIAPALTDTPLAKRLLSTDARREAIASRYPLKRFGQPTDIAAMADFLLSPRSSWITGQTIGVDGGMSAIVPL